MGNARYVWPTVPGGTGAATANDELHSFNTVVAQRTGLRAFSFDREDERAAMGRLLGLIVEDTFPTTKVMLSALVLYLNANDAGPGFHLLAINLGILPPGADEDAKLAFWAGQVEAVFAQYER